MSPAERTRIRRMRDAGVLAADRKWRDMRKARGAHRARLDRQHTRLCAFVGRCATALWGAG